jgi:Cu+-exporting ATPase
VVLRNRGLGIALASTIGLSVLGLVIHFSKDQAWLQEATPWITGALASIMVFVIGHHIFMMAVQALKRGILNQHVLLETAALAGIAGGLIGLVWGPPGFPTAPFFAVSVMVATYHIFSEWLSLIVKTRSSQAVKKLLDLQPNTARVIREGREQDIPIEQVALGDQVRIRPGERIPVDGEVIDGHSAARGDSGSVTVTFFNSLWDKPSIFFEAVMSVGRAQMPVPSRA